MTTVMKTRSPQNPMALLRECETLLTMHDRSMGWLCERGELLMKLRAAIATPVETTEKNLRRLTTLMAEDDGLWGQVTHIETAYVQQGLRYLTHYIEGEWTFRQAYDALKEMQP